MQSCPSCKSQVASNARVCPQCGHRFHTFLAKLFFWVVALPLFVAIAVGFILSTPQ